MSGHVHMKWIGGDRTLSAPCSRRLATSSLGGSSEIHSGTTASWLDLSDAALTFFDDFFTDAVRTGVPFACEQRASDTAVGRCEAGRAVRQCEHSRHVYVQEICGVRVVSRVEQVRVL
jgi:hypothetical protein